MIELEVLSAIRGHTTMYIEDVDAEKRKELATTVTSLLKEGHVIFLIQGEETRRVQGYDAEKNEWLLLGDPVERKTLSWTSFYSRRSARGTRATAVGRMAGG